MELSESSPARLGNLDCTSPTKKTRTWQEQLLVASETLYWVVTYTVIRCNIFLSQTQHLLLHHKPLKGVTVQRIDLHRIKILVTDSCLHSSSTGLLALLARTPQESLLLPAGTVNDQETPYVFAGQSDSGPSQAVPECCPKSLTIDFAVKSFDCLLE